MKYLYRGFNSSKSLEDALTPKNVGGDLETEAEFGDERVQFGDSDFTYGSSISNTVHSHEYGCNGEPTGGISSTPHFDRAKHYALGKNVYSSGTVIKFSIEKFKDSNVEMFRVADVVESPACPQDDEYWLWSNGEKISEDTIVELIMVSKDL